jgi:hypothetical protein
VAVCNSHVSFCCFSRHLLERTAAVYVPFTGKVGQHFVEQEDASTE